MAQSEKEKKELRQTLFGGAHMTLGEAMERITQQRSETLEDIIKEIHELEADRLVRLADEENDLREVLRDIREILRKKRRRGEELEAMGVTLELVRRYRKDYGETDWGA